MGTAQYGVAFSLGGLSIQQTINRTVDHPNGFGPITLAVAQPAILTTRTSDTAGTITMDSGGHTITTAAIIDIYDNVGGTVSYDATVGTVSGTSVPFTLAKGDVLPIATSVIAVALRTTINTTIDGDAIVMIGIEAKSTDASSTTAAHLQFDDTGAAEIAEIDLVANVPKIWDITGGDTNVFTGNPITACYASNGSLTETLNLSILSGEDSTP